MRTTIEITDNQRAQLLALAAHRGEKGFSRLVQEALDQYLTSWRQHDAEVRAAIGVLGSFEAETIEDMRATIRELRASWQ